MQYYSRARKILPVIILLILLLPAFSWAAGTVTVSRSHLSKDASVLVIKLACVGDASNGSVPATALSAAALSTAFTGYYYQQGFSLTEVWTVAGTPAPDEAGVTITDDISAALYTEADVIAASGTTEGTVTSHVVTGLLTVTVANQATASAKWDIYIKLVKNP